MMKKNKGLTLVEVLTVIVILAVLAGIAVPRFFGQQEKGLIPEAVEVLSAIRQGEEAFRMEYGTYIHTDDAATATVPAWSWAVLGMDAPGGSWTYAVTDPGGTAFLATATRAAGCSGQCCPSKTITMTNAGVYSGTHPYGPNPVSGATC